MKYIKMFIAGMTFPSILLPCLFFLSWILGKMQIFMIPFLHFIPLLWGVWNVLYFTFFSKVFPGNSTFRMLLTGGILGFLVAAYAVFGLHIPTLLGVPLNLIYLPLVVVPVLYAILWPLIVKPLNRLLGIYEDER
jgi:hypothetical protein